MAKASARTKPDSPRRLPRGRHALSADEVTRDQRERLLAAVPGVVAERGYEAMSVADIVKAAAVSRNAFYKSFSDKQDCVAVAHELGHERLFDVLTAPCAPSDPIEQRTRGSLAAALDALASEPDLARFLFVEAPSAGEQIALRYHEWLGRYGGLLRSAAAEIPAQSSPGPEVGQVIAGGIASRIASEVLQGRGKQLRDLTEPFSEYVLAFFRPSEPGPQEGRVIAFEPEREAAEAEAPARRKQAGA
jgi:AcrR family transcriptional regulator